MSQSAEGIRPQARRVLWRSLGLAGVVIGASIALGSGHAHAAETTSHASGSTSASTSTAAPTLQPVVDGLGRTLGGLTQHVATTLDQTVTALVPPARKPVRHPARHPAGHTGATAQSAASGGATTTRSARPGPQRCNDASPVTRRCIAGPIPALVDGLDATATTIVTDLGASTTTLVQDVGTTTAAVVNGVVDTVQPVVTGLVATVRPVLGPLPIAAAQPQIAQRAAPVTAAIAGPPASYGPSAPVVDRPSPGNPTDLAATNDRGADGEPGGSPAPSRPLAPSPFGPVDGTDHGVVPTGASSVSSSLLLAATAGAGFWLAGLTGGQRISRERIRMPRSRALRPTPRPA